LTFLLNQFLLLRFIDPAIFGASSRLELYNISVIFFARESFRVALARVSITPTTNERSDDVLKNDEETIKQDEELQSAINFSYLSVLLGLPLAVILGLICYKSMINIGEESSLVSIIKQSTTSAVFLYGLASVIELYCEPFFTLAQSLSLFRIRAGAEAIAAVAKTFTTAFTVLYFHHKGEVIDLMPFAFGQLSFAVSMFIFYIYSLKPSLQKGNYSITPTPMAREGYILSIFSVRLLNLSTSLYFQSIIKYILTQGDAIVITALATIQDQGAFALANNYGGLIARMLFQPIEESCRTYFARLCSSQQPSPPYDKDLPLSKNKENAINVLSALLHAYTTFLSIPALVLGPALSSPLLALVAGKKWSALASATSILGVYSYYIPLLAINGILEGFVAVTASERQVYFQSLVMGGAFVGFAATILVVGSESVGGSGAKGIVYGNCVNMGIRIVYCLWFVKKYCEENKLRDGWDVKGLLPSAGSVAVAVVTAGVLKRTEGIVVLRKYGNFGEIFRLSAIGGVMMVFM